MIISFVVLIARSSVLLDSFLHLLPRFYVQDEGCSWSCIESIGNFASLLHLCSLSLKIQLVFARKIIGYRLSLFHLESSKANVLCVSIVVNTRFVLESISCIGCLGYSFDRIKRDIS